MVVKIFLFLFTGQFPYRCSVFIVHIFVQYEKNKGVFYVNCLQFAIVSGLMFLTNFFAMF